MVSASSPAAASLLHRPFLRRLGLGLVIVAALIYLALLVRHTGAYAGGSDSSGYLNHAQRLRAGHLHVAPRTLPTLAAEHTPDFLYSALGIKPAPDGNGLVPTYPAGLPLMIAALSFAAGWDHAANVVMVLNSIAGVLLTFATGRIFGLSFRWSIVAAAIIAASPVYLQVAVQTMSDVPALTWTTAAVLAAWRSQQRVPWAGAAGLAFAVAVLVRPTNLLAILPIAFALGAHWRRWLWFLAAGLPGGVFFFLHTHAAYAAYFTTGYGSTTELGFSHVLPTLVHYAKWLPVTLTPVVFGFFALPRGTSRRPAVFLILWVFAIFGFYSTYLFTRDDWWYLRFILPAAPALVVGGMLGLRGCMRRWMTPRRSLALAAAASLAVVLHAARSNEKFGTLLAGEFESVYPKTCTWLRENLPADALIVSMQTSGALHYYTEFTYLRWDQIPPEQLPHVLDAVRTSGRPLYAALFPFEIEEWGFFGRFPGPWIQISNLRHVSIWKWEPGAPLAPPDTRQQTILSARAGSSHLTLRAAEGWYAAERHGDDLWHWAAQQAAFEFAAIPPPDAPLRFSFELRALAPITVIARQEGREVARFAVGRDRSAHTIAPLPLANGRARIEFSTSSPPVPENARPDARQLGFALYNPRLETK